jgi:hypothetical protein
MLLLSGGHTVVWSSVVDLACSDFPLCCNHCYGRWSGVYLVQLGGIFLVTDGFGPL